MLLTCPHCSDVAEIPGVFRKFYGMPIACHACSGVFYVPKKVEVLKRRPVLNDYQRHQCSTCNVSLLMPDLTSADAKLLRKSFEKGMPVTPNATMLCPACKAHIATDRLWPSVKTRWSVERALPLIIGGVIGAIIVYSSQHGYLAFDSGEAARNAANELKSFWNETVEAARSVITSVKNSAP